MKKKHEDVWVYRTGLLFGLNSKLQQHFNETEHALILDSMIKEKQCQ